MKKIAWIAYTAGIVGYVYVWFGTYAAVYSNVCWAGFSGCR